MTTEKTTDENGVTRREALASIGGVAAGAALTSAGVIGSAQAAEEGILPDASHSATSRWYFSRLSELSYFPR